MQGGVFMKHLVKNGFFDFDRLFDDDLFPTIFTRGGNPRMEIFENESDIVVKAELPGLTKDDIAIDLKDSVLTISGEKKQEEIEPGARYHRTEISYGEFRRSFHLGYDVNAEEIEASFVDGVLTVNIPKAAPDQGKTSIEIR